MNLLNFHLTELLPVCENKPFVFCIVLTALCHYMCDACLLCTSLTSCVNKHPGLSAASRAEQSVHAENWMDPGGVMVQGWEGGRRVADAVIWAASGLDLIFPSHPFGAVNLSSTLLVWLRLSNELVLKQNTICSCQVENYDSRCWNLLPDIPCMKYKLYHTTVYMPQLLPLMPTSKVKLSPHI